MGGRTLPHYCEHGVPVDGGDFVDSENCPECQMMDDLPEINTIYKGRFVAIEKLQAERERVRVLRGAIIDIVEQSRDWTITSIAEEALIETADSALQATAQEGL